MLPTYNIPPPSGPSNPHPNASHIAYQIDVQSLHNNQLQNEVAVLEGIKAELFRRRDELITQKKALTVDMNLAQSAINMLEYQIQEQSQNLNLLIFEKSKLEAVQILGNRVIQLQQQIQALQNSVPSQQSMPCQSYPNIAPQTISQSFGVIQKLLPKASQSESNFIELSSDDEDNVMQPMENSYEKLPGTERLIGNDSSQGGFQEFQQVYAYVDGMPVYASWAPTSVSNTPTKNFN